MPEPRVSVLMPVFNSAPFLSASIESLLNQTLADIQIVTINDGSTDDSGAMLNRLATTNRRIEVYHRPNRGVVATLNEGIELCRGEFIARMDADDVALPQRLERQLLYMQSRPTTLALGSAIQYLGPDGLTTVRTHPPVAASDVNQELPKRNCISHPTVMFRKAAVQAVGGYRPPYIHAEDYDLWLRLRSRGDLENLPQVLLQYRIHQGQISARQLRVQAISVAAARLNMVPTEVPAAVAEASILDTASGWAALLIKTRQLNAAWELMQNDEFFKLPTCRRQSAARRHWLTTRWHWARGDKMAAMAALLHTAINDPTWLVKTGCKIVSRRRLL